MKSIFIERKTAKGLQCIDSAVSMHVSMCRGVKGPKGGPSVVIKCQASSVGLIGLEGQGGRQLHSDTYGHWAVQRLFLPWSTLWHYGICIHSEGY
jgi:hypothetical protein